MNALEGRSKSTSREEPNDNVIKLRERLADVEETLRAITHGEIDALIVTTLEGDKVFTLEGADKPYRLFVEQMSEGAATISIDGLVLYSNNALASLLKMPLEKVMGLRFDEYVLPLDRPVLKELEKRSKTELSFGRISLTADDGTLVPVRASVSMLRAKDVEIFCLILSDITEMVRSEEALRRMNDELELKVNERTASLERTNELLKAEVIERVLSQRHLADEKERFALVLDSIGDALITTDELNRVVLMNQAAELITGWRTEEALGKALEETFTLVTFAPEPLALTNRIQQAGKRTERRQACIKKRGGGLVRIEYGGVPLRGSDSRSQAKAIVFREVKG